MKMSEVKPDAPCVVCCRSIRIFAVGHCDHIVCYICSSRMRVLCKQLECPICRQVMQKVYYTKLPKLFAQLELSERSFIREKKFGIFFETSRIADEFHQLLEHVCMKCENEPVFYEFQDLQDHLKRIHELYFCEICVEHVKLFTDERKTYNRVDLARHRRIGDKEDTSHKGHPLCEFCEQRFLDNDELYRHLRKEHFFCHFCDADGLNQYYGDYNVLRDHFRVKHYLCEEGDCTDERFTNVFRTDIDLTAHRAEKHSKGLSKVQAKQARTLDLTFAVRPRDVIDFGGGRTSSRYTEGSEEATSGSSGRGPHSRNRQKPNEQPNNSHTAQRNIQPPEQIKRPEQKIEISSITDFPSLSKGNSTTANSFDTTLANRLAKSQGMSVRGIGALGLNTAEFPSLGRSKTLTQPAVPSAHVAKPLTISYNKTLSSKKPAPAATSNPVVNGASNHSEAKKLSEAKLKGSDFPSLTLGAPASSSVTNWKPEEKKKEPVKETNLDNKPNKQRNFVTLTKGTPMRKQREPEAAFSTELDAFPHLNRQQKSEERAVTPKRVDKKESSSSKPVVNQKGASSLTLASVASLFDQEPKPPSSKPGRTDSRNGDTQLESPLMTLAKANSAQKLNVVSTRPPPGFSEVPSLLSVLKPPPGFSNMGFQQFDAPRKTYSYLEPVNFDERKETMLKSIRIQLFTDDKRTDWAKLNINFNQGSISAKEYYEKSRAMLGDYVWQREFPDVLTLLPYISKQQELLEAHNLATLDNKMLSELVKPSSKFLVCATCMQVLLPEDFRGHTAAHNC